MSLVRRIANIQLKGILDEQRDDFTVATQAAINSYIERMTAYNLLTVPKAKGTLRQSGVTVLKKSEVRGIGFTVFYGFATALVKGEEEYAFYADRGRPPGDLPPIKKIEQWAVLVGLPKSAAYGIATNIATFGTVQYLRGGSAFFDAGVLEAKITLEQELNFYYDQFDLGITIDIP